MVNKMSKLDSKNPIFQFLFIKPIFSSLLLIMIILSGTIAYLSMIKESNPDLEIPQALITTTWPSASPDLVEKEITNKIEKKLKSLKGLKKISSGSLNSTSVIAVDFNADADMQESMQLLRARVNEAESDLPKEAKKPKIEPVSMSDIPIITFMLYGDIDDAILSKAAKNLKLKLEKISGIKKVEITGDRLEIIQIQLIPERLNALGISPTLVQSKIKEANIDVPWSKLENEDFTATLKMSGRFKNLKELKELPIIRINNSRLVRLKEIAEVKRDLAREDSKAYLSKSGSDYNKSIAVSVYKLPGKDTIQLTEDVKKTLEIAKDSSEWPHSMSYMIIADESKLIWENLSNVFNNCWQGMLAVFIILFVLLTWKEALIAGLSIPITLLGSIAIIYAFGYTLNEIIIIGMILAFGIMVDDFILMMEGMHHAMIELKMNIADAQLHTLKTYAIPSLSGSLTTIIVFIPLMCIGGVDGKFIRLIPITAAICLVLSYLVSVFINVPLSSVILKGQKTSHDKSKVDQINDKLSEQLSNWLQTKPLSNKRNAIGWVLAMIILLAITIASIDFLPSILYPKSDGRNFGISIELSPSTSLDKSHEIADKIGEKLKDKKYLESVTKYVGKKSPFSVKDISDYLTVNEAPYLVGFSCLFVPRDQREKMAFEYARELREDIEPLLKDYPGAMLIMSPDIGGSTSADPIQIEITGENMDELRKISTDVQSKLSKLNGVIDVRDSLGPTSIDVKLEPKREALQFYGINLQDMVVQVRLAMADDEIGKFKMPGSEDDLEIRMGFQWPSRKGEMGGAKNWEEVALIGIFDQQGQRIPLLSVLDPIVNDAPLSITHKKGSRAVAVTAKNENRAVIDILNEFEKELIEMKKTWPPNYNYYFAGEAESSTETYGSMFNAFLIAVFLVFAILTLLFNNYKQPFIIMFTVLFAMIGTFGGFFLAWIPISFPAMVGMISLVGIVVNDAIVMIDTMNQHINNGLGVKVSAARGASDRLRPIISTTLTTTVGLIPLALSSPMWMPLCAAIIFGLLAATVVSLVIVPCLFILMTPERVTVSE